MLYNNAHPKGVHFHFKDKFMQRLIKSLIPLVLSLTTLTAQAGLYLKINTPADAVESLCTMNPDPCLPLNNSVSRANGLDLWTTNTTGIAWLSIVSPRFPGQIPDPYQCTQIPGVLGDVLLPTNVITIPLVMNTYQIMYFQPTFCNILANHCAIPITSLPVGSVFIMQVIAIRLDGLIGISNPQGAIVFS